MRIYLTAIASLGIALSAQGQSDPVPSANNQPTANAATGTLSAPLSPEEARLLNQLHTVNVTEIAAGKLAAQNTANPSITEFGTHLMQDHIAADRELVKLSKARGVTLSKPKTSELDTLRGLKGTQFDRTFVNTMLRDHQRTISLIEGSLEGFVQAPDVRKFLERTLTTLKMHRDRAEQLQANQS